VTEFFNHVARFVDIPAPGAFDASQVVRNLGEGLVLRCASVHDTDALDGFSRVFHADPPG
jgi:hypothetical protein